MVLVGHSQGTGHLRRLIEEEIDGQTLQDRLVSAVLLGSSVAVPDGEVVGGSFDAVPICTEEGEVGCVISYATFRATDPPPATTFFGVVEGPERAACTNPAALGGGSATLTPYFTTAGQSPLVGADPAEITTEWVTYPDFLTAECVQSDDVDWLELTIAADPADPRTDDIPGDLTPEWASTSSTPTWPWATSTGWSRPRPPPTQAERRHPPGAARPDLRWTSSPVGGCLARPASSAIDDVDGGVRGR